MLIYLIYGHPGLEGVSHVVDSSLGWYRELPEQFFLFDRPFDLLVATGRFATLTGQPLIVLIQPQAKALYLHGADTLLQGLLEGSADTHGLAHAFHLCR